ncbi:Ig-like domain-containing protein [Marinicella sp. S1101]|uniref:Ig-like domain-containing protein n=1 Tax=Marinicella marina TaxID=2996016 RepID=UPI00226086F1|nr:Ig-like domain-containing protein [Marinicella marina]MCX7554781.1 Ig-like domain-containing protein [Marinicella marina]MDJ1140986.1 Ig-like domain-containing protein [Marinicella marina]
MKLKPILFTLTSIVLLQACSSGSNSPRAVETPPVTNPGGGVVTGVIEAVFDPASGDPTKVPIPTNLFLSGTTDLTLNIPVADPTDFSDPLVALNGLDGFSTVAPWATNFSVEVAATTVNPGSVKLYEVTLTGPGGGVTGVVNELTFGVDFVAAANGSSVAIVPIKPLKQLTSYMAVITNGVQDTDGNAATPSQTYFLSKRTSPLVDGAGNSTDPLLENATAQALEPLRQLTNAQEAAAASQGVDPANIVISWTATTQSITPVLTAAKAITTPGSATLAPTGLSTSAIGGAGIADIYIGTMSSPYYLTAPSAANPIAPLNQFWKAAPGAYNPPFDAFGLDPTSTNLTFANPIPVATSVQNLPVLMTVPNAGSGQVKPEAGWPVMIYQHGITRDRTDMLAVADTMASVGFAVVAIDLAMHGITDPTNPFYVENSPFGAIASERTFDVDYINNETGAPGPDGVVDSSGAHFINLANLLVSRDNTRQGIADLFTLTETIPFMDIDGDGAGDFNEGNITFTGQSLGAITGTGYLAFAPNVQSAVLSAPGGGIASLLIGSPTFGPRIIAGLQASGVEPGTTAFNLFVLATQTAVDSADPINLGQFAALQNNVLLHQINGDVVVTNRVDGAPLSGTEPLIAAMGLTSYSESAADPAGLDAAVRFTAGDHGSLLSPAASPAATVEMQSQMAAFQATGGTVLNITNTDVIQ